MVYKFIYIVILLLVREMATVWQISLSLWNECCFCYNTWFVNRDTFNGQDTVYWAGYWEGYLENGGVLGRVLRRLLDRIDDKAVTVLSKSESLAKIWWNRRDFEIQNRLWKHCGPITIQIQNIENSFILDTYLNYLWYEE